MIRFVSWRNSGVRGSGRDNPSTFFTLCGLLGRQVSEYKAEFRNPPDIYAENGVLDQDLNITNTMLHIEEEDGDIALAFGGGARRSRV